MTAEGWDGPRQGELLVEGTLRPWAERLVDLLGVRSGDRVLDVVCDGGVLTSRLARAVGATGSVLAVDPDESAVGAAREACRGLDRVTVMRGDPAALPVDPGCMDAAASLFGLGLVPCDVAAVAAELRRVLRPGGTAALVTWEPGGAPHEEGLAAAVAEATGSTSPFMARVLGAGAALSAVVDASDTLRDVVRFEGMGQLWLGLVGQRPLALEAAAWGDQTAAEVRRRLEVALAPWTAFDGTMRVPTRARVGLLRGR